MWIYFCFALHAVSVRRWISFYTFMILSLFSRPLIPFACIHTSWCMGGLGSDGSGKTPFIAASTVIAGQTVEDYDVWTVSISLQCVFIAAQRTTTRRNIKSNFSDQVAKWKEVNFPSISKYINSLTVPGIEVDFFSVSKHFVTQFIVEWFIVSLWLFCFI